MKLMEIKKLDWDSDFFNIEIGELINLNSNQNNNFYDLIYVKQLEDNEFEIENYLNTFKETKIVFKKELSTSKESLSFDNSFDFDTRKIEASLLYPLAFESGKYSRFKLDDRFGNDKFEQLYKKWVDNSINKKFADKIFYYLLEKEVVGFVTVKNSNDFSTIGLIAVDNNYQGRGIGKQLINIVENYCLELNINELRIPTQKENISACNFYKKLDYNVFEALIIKHYWKKNDTI